MSITHPVNNLPDDLKLSQISSHRLRHHCQSVVQSLVDRLFINLPSTICNSFGQRPTSLMNSLRQYFPMNLFFVIQDVYQLVYYPVTKLV